MDEDCNERLKDYKKIKDELLDLEESRKGVCKAIEHFKGEWPITFSYKLLETHTKEILSSMQSIKEYLSVANTMYKQGTELLCEQATEKKLIPFRNKVRRLLKEIDEVVGEAQRHRRECFSWDKSAREESTQAVSFGQDAYEALAKLRNSYMILKENGYHSVEWIDDDE